VRSTHPQGRVDHANTTTALLGAGATFTGAATDIVDYAMIRVFAYSDVASADGGAVDVNYDLILVDNALGFTP
jgi:hypothetical protein